jgi:hypothetical protein
MCYTSLGLGNATVNYNAIWFRSYWHGKKKMQVFYGQEERGYLNPKVKANQIEIPTAQCH